MWKFCTYARTDPSPIPVKWSEWSDPAVVEKNGQSYWLVKVIYRAKNSFGGYVIGGGAAYIQNDRVIHYEDLQLK